jgi:hypothetical protein
MTAPRDFPLSLDAGVPQTLRVAGYYFGVISAPAGPVQLAFDGGPFIERSAGMGGGGRFSEIIIKSVLAQTVVLAVVMDEGGTLYDSRATVNAAITAPIEVSNTILALADVTVPAGATAALVAADTARKELNVKLPSTAAAAVRLGAPANVAAGVGFRLEPGESIVLPTTAAVTAYCEGVADETVSLTETRFV